MKNAIIYDIEIRKAIPDKKTPIEEGIEYCAGWDDYANMGIAVVGCYDYNTDRYRVFGADNIAEFEALVRERETYVSFNGVGFDNKVLAHHIDGKLLATELCYDVLREIWVADGLKPEFAFPSHIGYSLGAVAFANMGIHKSGEGANAPIEWQRGNVGAVIDYCLNDVKITKRLFDRVRQIGGLRSPKAPTRFLDMRKPA